MTDTARAAGIAILARHYALLARRPEFLAADPAHLLRHALTEDAPGPLPMVDAAMMRCSSELDRLCGYAVAVLSRADNMRKAPILDVLGVLDPDRVCAIYYALPPERRSIAQADPAFGYHVQGVAHLMVEAIADLEDYVAATGTTDLQRQMARVAWANTA